MSIKTVLKYSNKKFNKSFFLIDFRIKLETENHNKHSLFPFIEYVILLLFAVQIYFFIVIVLCTSQYQYLPLYFWQVHW